MAQTVTSVEEQAAISAVVAVETLAVEQGETSVEEAVEILVAAVEETLVAGAVAISSRDHKRDEFLCR
jgi:hypothetical protein